MLPQWHAPSIFIANFLLLLGYRRSCSLAESTKANPLSIFKARRSRVTAAGFEQPTPPAGRDPILFRAPDPGRSPPPLRTDRPVDNYSLRSETKSSREICLF